MLVQGNCAMPQLFFFVLSLPTTFTTSLRVAELQKPGFKSSKNTGAKQNLAQNGDSMSFKVTCFAVSGKAIRH